MIESLNYLGFNSPKIQEWSRFGPEVIGLEIADDQWGDGSLRFRMDDAAYRIAIHPGNEDEFAYIGWGVSGPTELAAALSVINGAGFKINEADDALLKIRGVADMFWFNDPFGVRQEISWGQLNARRPFRPGRAHNGFVTGQGGLGHIALLVPEIKEAEKFYVDVLKFQISDEINSDGLQMRFYHCNERHHSLAFVQIPGLSGIHHVMMEVESIDDLGRVMDLADDGKVELTRRLGRHVNDEMVSIYIKTPTKFEIEYGCYARVLSRDSNLPRTYDKGSVWGHKFTAGPPTDGLFKKV